MWTIKIERGNDKFNRDYIKEYEFFNSEIAISEYVSWCLMFKSYEYAKSDPTYTDIYIICDGNIKDHHYFIDGRYK